MTDVIHYWIPERERAVAMYWPSDQYANLCGGDGIHGSNYTSFTNKVTCPDCLKKLGVETKPEDSVGMTAVGEDGEEGWYLVQGDESETSLEVVKAMSAEAAAKLVLSRPIPLNKVRVQKLGAPREFRRVTAVEEVK